MRRSSELRLQRGPARRIPWTALRDEQDVADQVRASLPSDAPSKSAVDSFLQGEGLIPSEDGHEILYAYVDGPKTLNSPVEVEWYLEFRFSEERLVDFSVERRLVGP